MTERCQHDVVYIEPSFMGIRVICEDCGKEKIYDQELLQDLAMQDFLGKEADIT